MKLKDQRSETYIECIPNFDEREPKFKVEDQVTLAKCKTIRRDNKLN